ncbi:MAG: DUF262 domain-containing HNH endonuclease family protein [Euryarchaeota archaeon]|nr:DUF262 domain-containing HNH endonuclease family protein [Euryarchaeota archaeon]
MATNRIYDLFNKRYFEIPKYQRGYSWDRQNVRDLFEDVREAIESGFSHYMGTVVLSEGVPQGEHYFVVDGQQRLATISLIISEITHRLPKADADYHRRFYIREDDYRLKPLGRDKQYFEKLLERVVLNPENKSQRLLKDAYEEIGYELNRIKDMQTLMKAIERLEIMEFVEKSEGDAIRIFQTVNDRGKPLTNMEKAKALLVYYSNRYLSKKLDGDINDAFGEIFELYDDIKQIADDENIRLIRSKDFDEDNIMRYHFVSFSDEAYDVTAPYVLGFLKRNLGSFRSDSQFNEMEIFISQYVGNLLNFFRALKSILGRVMEDSKYYKVFVVLGPSATLYPLIVKLEILGRLDKDIPNLDRGDGGKYTFFDLLELIDVRVYKTRGTHLRAEISKYASDLNDNFTDEEIRDWLLWFNAKWMPQSLFESNMMSNVYDNAALPYMFLNYCEHFEDKPYSRDDIKKLLAKKPTIEHILSQHPTFCLSSYGFQNETDFADTEHHIGNLTWFEHNSAVGNHNPFEKAKTYDKSSFRMTRKLSFDIFANSGVFNKSSIENRTKEIYDYAQARWWC